MNKATFKRRVKKMMELAEEAAASTADWVALHNAVYGIGGHFAQQFASESDRVAFSKTPEFQQIAKLIEDKRAEDADSGNAALRELARRTEKANGRMNIRVPRSVHAALLAEAESEGVSLNQLCLAKLCLQLKAAIC